MPEYRRLLRPGGTYFFTLVTYHRRPLFGDELCVGLLRDAVRAVRREMPFDFVAGVALYDHLHFMWTLPEGDADYSGRIGRIKAAFTKSLPPDWRAPAAGRGTGGRSEWRAMPALPGDVPSVERAPPAGSRGRSEWSGHRQRGYSHVWQPRFWEHMIRDMDDFEKHLNYTHYNPVKHGYVQCPHQWGHSSFDKWVRRAAYEPDWCCCCDGRSVIVPDFAGMEEAECE